MSVGEDIRDVLLEVGVAFNVIRFSGISGETIFSGERLDFEPNAQVTKPFIREHFLDATLPFDTQVTAGDVLIIDVMAETYMVMNLSSMVFENTVVEKSAVLYKCNVSGELLRPSGEIWDTATYQKTPAWETIKTNAYGLLSETAFGTDLEQEAPAGQIELKNYVLFLPNSYGAKPLDRYSPKSGEWVKIETVMPRRFNKVDLCEVSEDTR